MPRNTLKGLNTKSILFVVSAVDTQLMDLGIFAIGVVGNRLIQN